jgi:hypothetical protein
MNTIKYKTIIFALFLGMALYGCSSNGNSSEQQNAAEEHEGHNHEAATTGEEHNEALSATEEELGENEVEITGKQMEGAGIRLGETREQQ